MRDPPIFPTCGTPLAQGGRSGLCPACLLQAAMVGDSLQHPASFESDAYAGGKAMSPSPLSELTGARTGRYWLLEQIGEGGFGVVSFYSRIMPRTGPRRAIARLHPALDVRSCLEGASGKLRNAVSSLTREMEATVQAGIKAINLSNDAPGATLVHEAP